MLSRRANDLFVDANVEKSLNKKCENCKVCYGIISATKRFKLTHSRKELNFNYRLQVDTIFISGRPIIHMVNGALCFRAAYFLCNQTTKEI